MKKNIYFKILCILLSLVFALSCFSGCSNKKAANLNDIERNLDELGYNKIGDPTPSPTPTPEYGYKIEHKKKETPVQMDKSVASGNIDLMLRVYKLIEAHKFKVLYDNDYELDIQNDIETLSSNALNKYDNLIVRNGDKINDDVAEYSLAVAYYYDYSNLYVDSVVDYRTYAIGTKNTIQELKEELLGENPERDINNLMVPNTSMMIGAIRVVDFMTLCDQVLPLKIRNDNSYVISGKKSAYAIDLQCIKDLEKYNNYMQKGINALSQEEIADYNENINTQLIAVFDASGNLMNIIIPAEFESYTYTKDLTKEIKKEWYNELTTSDSANNFNY